MGKEQDLLEASRSGHYHIIEKILTARIKKSGPLNLTSLRRLPGPNTTDPRNGFTCLHYASLNGHKDIVRILLEHGANPNVVDHNGSSPLHLASWTGDYEIVDMLISINNAGNGNNSSGNNNSQTNDNSAKRTIADINLKNKDNETALHSACQYGHTPVVSLLLTQGADPFVQNIRHETPLDLASQYGRLETIELLLRIRFDLLNEYLPTNRNNNQNSVIRRPHSPLHLASRNGHKSIVKLLLDLGFDVNYLTVNGTALHDAVLCGKNEVVRLLLEAGTNIQLCNDHGQKVTQLLEGLNTSVAKQTRKLIREHIQRINDNNLDDDDQIMNRTNELISPMSDSTTSHISHTNSYGGGQLCGDHSQSEDQDLTIVDSMLQEDMNILYNHQDNNNPDFDDLIMDDEDGTDIQCISPPPGYTDGDHMNEHDDDRHQVDHLYPLSHEHGGRLDCISPSSSLFSTSIFSELASIFDEHLNQRNGTESKCIESNQLMNDGSIESHSAQIKSSNSFTIDDEKLMYRSSTSNQRFFDDDPNNKNRHFHHHQSFNDVAIYGRDSPSRRITSPNLLVGGASSSNILTHDDHLSLGMMMMMSTSLNSKSNFDNVIVNNNNDSVIISSSNYSISSAASSTTNMNKTSGIQPPTKPPRKTIDAKKISKAKSVDQCSVSTKVKLSTLVDQNDNSKVSLGMTRLDSDEKRQPPSSTTIKTNQTESRLSDLVDSSDHSTSQDMNSVISKNENNQTKSKKTKKPQTIVSKLKDNDEVHIDSSLLSSATHHSIDDFYLLYDQAAREEYEKEKSNNHQQDHRSSVNYQCWKQQTPQQQRLQSSSQLLKSKAEVNEQQILTNVNKPIVSNSNRETDNILMPKNDPPSPNSAETEIIHAMEPLRQQFYDDHNITILKTNGHYSVSAEPKRTKRRKKAVSILTKNCHHYQDCRDNWTLTDPDNNEQFNENNMEKHENNKKSIGILVQLGNVDKNAKLITRCGVEGHARNRHHRNPNKRQQQRSEQQPNLSTQPSEQKRKNNEQPQSTDYYSAFCETLKFDKKGEKENPFAGLCRGGLTPAKSIGNNRNVTVQPAPSSSNGTMEKKKKTVELSEARKSLRKQRSILSGRAESLTKLNNGKFSVHNHTGNDDNHEEKKKTKSIDQRSSTTMTGAMITQPNNIYATLRKKKKSKSLNGDHQLTVIDIDGGHQQNSDGLHSTDTKDRLLNNKTSILQDQSQQIFLWLKEIDMQQYKDILIQNGYDDLDFMDNNVMDDNDLIEIGIIQALHRDAILRAAQLLPYRTPKLTRDQIQQLSIAEWLAFIHLKQYVDIFHNNGLTELRKIRNIWEVELETMLEIDKCGHRRRILYSLSDFNQRDSMIVSDNSDALSPWLSTDNASTCTNLERERDRTTEQQQNPSTTSWKGWKHARHELINGECQYLVNYLGSTLVRELRGIDSTRASIGKLKSATATSNEKILKILLSISCQGVQFKDSKSNRLICEHEIRNIHCICQDSEDLNYFAYITKDFETNNHYCHVFMSTQTDLVTEIILTLGQAFEIAYQIVLEQYNIHVKQQTTTISATNQASLIAKEHGNLSSSSSGTQNQGDQNNNLHSTFVKLNQPQKSDEQRSSSVNDSIQEHCKVVQQSLNDDVSINEKPIEQEFRLLSTPMLPTSMHIEKDQIEANSKPIMSKVENYTNGTEELYAVVDKSRKTKSKSLQQQPKIINEQKQMNESEKENRPVPPIRSSSTASSNSSTGTRPDSKQQSQPKPKPPVRVQSMQNQQKPEVSPKPKNLINKSNTVTSSSMNSKPVLARYQPQLFSFQQPHPNQSNHSESLSPMTNSLPSQVSQVSTFINHNQMIDRKF